MSGDSRIPTIGIIGAGNIGQAFARLALRAGREVVIANSRGLQSLAPVSAELLGVDPHDAGGRRVLFLSGDDAARLTRAQT